MLPYNIGLAVALTVELVLAYGDFSEQQWATSLAEFLGYFFPVIDNFRRTGGAGLLAGNYIAISFLFFPVKIMWGLAWAVNHADEVRSTFSVTPYSKNRSWKAKIIFLILSLSFLALMGFYVFHEFWGAFFREGDNLESQRTKYSWVLHGGYKMWFSWSVLHQFLLGSLTGGTVWFVKEWLVFVRDKIFGEDSDQVH